MSYVRSNIIIIMTDLWASELIWEFWKCDGETRHLSKLLSLTKKPKPDFDFKLLMVPMWIWSAYVQVIFFCKSARCVLISALSFVGVVCVSSFMGLKNLLTLFIAYFIILCYITTLNQTAFNTFNFQRIY